MKDFITHVHQFITGGAGMTITSVIAVWIIGMMSGSKAYKAARAAYGKAMRGAGRTINAVAGSKFGKPIWNPIEKVAVDLIGFGSEEFVGGLQEDDLQALADQHERLSDVGSVDRVAMIAKKIKDAIDEGAELPKDPTATAIIENIQAAAAEKLKS